MRSASLGENAFGISIRCNQAAYSLGVHMLLPTCDGRFCPGFMAKRAIPASGARVIDRFGSATRRFLPNVQRFGGRNHVKTYLSVASLRRPSAAILNSLQLTLRSTQWKRCPPIILDQGSRGIGWFIGLSGKHKRAFLIRKNFRSDVLCDAVEVDDAKAHFAYLSLLPLCFTAASFSLHAELVACYFGNFERSYEQRHSDHHHWVSLLRSVATAPGRTLVCCRSSPLGAIWHSPSPSSHLL